MIHHLLHIGNLDCHCAAPSPHASRIIYILFPLSGSEAQLEAIASRYESAVVAVSGMDWDNDLTPWPAPGAPQGEPPFQGRGPEFLKLIEHAVVPRCEEALDVQPLRRQLVGVSLSGLFSLWQWMQSALFMDIACISGSFWYQGFTSWLSSLTIPRREGLAWFCLGDREAATHIKAFRSVATDTATVIATLRDAGIHAEFLSVRGNHYQHLEERLTYALDALSGVRKVD